MAAIIKGFDERIRDSIERVNTIKEKMLQVEKEITEKKNADNKEYSNEIILLKKSLVDYRKKYELVKKNMFTDGINITKELKNIIDEKEQSINNKFDDVCKKIRAKNTDPSKGEIAKSIAITKQKFNTDIVNYVAPVTEILNFYENEIVSLHDVVVLWSGKVVATIQKDSVLSKQLEPLNKELTGYNSDPKKNKKEIAELKKQCSKIEKERKELANQMEDDCKELSGYLKQQCKEIFSALNVRFVDIIENINYSYQDKF
jgi:predicted  nucleic acid-binding Zn-ribbon protein